jgi:hypothetical protein
MEDWKFEMWLVEQNLLEVFRDATEYEKDVDIRNL